MFSARLLTLALSLVAAAAFARESSATESIVVGSKRFAESTILGEAAAQAARTTGAKAEHREGLGGTAIVFRALEQGDIDLYPEYTGTLVEAVLHEKGRIGRDALASRLAEKHLCITAPLGFENTYALAVSDARESTTAIRRISDLEGHPKLEVGLSNEFKGREDGWLGLSRTYGIDGMKPREMDHGLAYQALASGSIDVIEVYSTDAKIEREHLRVLEDDKHFFPAYEAIYVYRCDLATRAPHALEAVSAIAGSIGSREMIASNAKVEVDGATPRDVARSLLDGKTDAPVHRAGWLSGLFEVIAREGPRHLSLVLASLALAIVVGVPLGIVAQRRRRLGAVILSSVGVLQTIPALALLCFFIPLFGIGTIPTIVALFLYGLLPIVRNTFTGLDDIAPGLRESAIVLGLTGSRRLFGVELPLASRTILAGIKTSAVINVGTATVAAFVGAGGFGQPISTGLSLNDNALILQGAVPAALLALSVQGVFALLERLLVPRGLRLAPPVG